MSTRKRSIAWGIGHPPINCPLSTEKQKEWAVSVKDLKRMARQYPGKPVVLGHENTQRRNRLGKVLNAFVADDGALHLQFEFDHKSFNSQFLKRLSSKGRCNGLSLSLNYALDKETIKEVWLSPRELSVVPLSTAVRGKACKIYYVDGNWHCTANQRKNYRSQMSTRKYDLNPDVKGTRA